MDTFFAKSPDGVKIAYDRSGSGLPLVLIHGGGSNRGDWHECGYVDRLQKDYTVITLDLRGHGESDMPTDQEAYDTEKMGDDILSVVDACNFEQFFLWGMSFGGKVSRYLASKSNRVSKLVLLSATMGPGAPDDLREEIEKFNEKWPPIVKSQNEGTLDLEALAENDREFLLNFNVPVIMAWGKAMLEWPMVEPADILCPTLIVAGSDDKRVMEGVRIYETELEGTQVQQVVVDGLDHSQVLVEIDTTMDIFLSFTNS